VRNIDATALKPCSSSGISLRAWASGDELATRKIIDGCLVGEAPEQLINLSSV
jgi:hypothetical protein